MVIDQQKYGELCASFEREYKRIEPYKSRRELTKNEAKLIEHRRCIIKTYNDIVTFFEPHFSALSNDLKLQIENEIITHLRKLKECFKILRLEYQFDANIFNTIDINKIIEIDTGLNLQTTSKQSQINTKTSDRTVNNTEKDQNNKQISTSLDNQSNSDTETLTDSENSFDSTIEMAQTPEKFMKVAHQTISTKYNGDPLNLDSFSDSINLLKTMCKDENKELMAQYIMTRLEGKARGAISETPKTTDEIIVQLKEGIKTESAKVIEGRMLALRADKTNLTRFSERAEELAEQYRRRYIERGLLLSQSKRTLSRKDSGIMP